MVNKEKHVDDVLKKLEQGIEKIAEVFDQYTEAVRQEIAFINQRMTELESKVDGAASWSSYTGEKREARPISLGSREPADFVTAARIKLPRQSVEPPPWRRLVHRKGDSIYQKKPTQRLPERLRQQAVEVRAKPDNNLQGEKCNPQASANPQERKQSEHTDQLEAA